MACLSAVASSRVLRFGPSGCRSVPAQWQSPVNARPSQQRDARCRSLEERFQNSFTMSQVYVADRPPPIPLSEHEARRKRRELEELQGAAKRARPPMAPDVVAQRVAELDSLLPGLINLHKAKASDWVAILRDVPGVMGRVIALKEVFPKVNMLRVVSANPRLLLRAPADLVADAQKARAMLGRVPDPDAVVDTVPDLIDPVNLTRALASLAAAFKGKDPLEMLAANPKALKEITGGEGDMEDSAEYGELSTKD